MRPLGQRSVMNFEFSKFKASRYSAFASRQYYEANYKDGHMHDFIQVWYCCSGKYVHRVGDYAYVCTEGSVIIVPSGTYHEISFTEGESEVLELNVSYKLFLEASPDRLVNTIANLCVPAFSQGLRCSACPYVMLSPQSRLQAEEHLSWFAILRYAPQGIVRKEEIYEKIECLFSLPEFAINEKYRKNVLHSAQTQLYPIFRIISYLNIHYPEKIAEERLLQEGGISRRGMYRYFKRIAGFAYSQYLQQLRVSRALVYLRQSRYSLTYISDLCGFCNISYMTRIFQRCIGESPKKVYEKMNKCKY